MATNSEARKRTDENVRTVSATIPVTNEMKREAEEQMKAAIYPYADMGEVWTDLGKAVFSERGSRPAPVPPLNRRSEILQGAERAVNGERNVSYGDPRTDFYRTAALWTAYLENQLATGEPILSHDVAAMMCLLKISRIAWSPEKMDSWLDLAGYAACGWDCADPSER